MLTYSHAFLHTKVGVNVEDAVGGDNDVYRPATVGILSVWK